MADLGGVGIGAGGGAIAAALIYAIDKVFGPGKAIKDLGTVLEARFAALEAKVADLEAKTLAVHDMARRSDDWHNVQDPDDPAGKIWYFSVGLRRAVRDLTVNSTTLLDLLRGLVSRFDRYNDLLEKLLQALEGLGRRIDALERRSEVGR